MLSLCEINKTILKTVSVNALKDLLQLSFKGLFFVRFKLDFQVTVFSSLYDWSDYKLHFQPLLILKPNNDLVCFDNVFCQLSNKHFSKIKIKVCLKLKIKISLKLFKIFISRLLFFYFHNIIHFQRKRTNKNILSFPVNLFK